MATFKWEQLARRQKIYIAAAAVLLIGIVFWAVTDAYQARQSIRVFEQQAIEAKRDAQIALVQAEKIGREKLEVEKKLAEKESERDGKVTEVEAAKVKILSDRLELNRARRERRGDNPSAEQLCAELDALGIACD